MKALDRTNRGRNRIVADRLDTADTARRDRHNDQVFGAIVTEKSLAKDFPEAFYAWLEEHKDRRWEWPNPYVDVRQFVAFYRYMWQHRDKPPAQAVGPQATIAEELAVSPSDDPDTAPPLVILGAMLLDRFRTVPTIGYIPMDYFPLHYGNTKRWNFGPQPSLTRGQVTNRPRSA